MVNKFESNGLEYYPHKFDTSLQLEDLFKRYNSLPKECGTTDKFESSAGRVWQMRSASKKLIFADVRSGN